MLEAIDRFAGLDGDTATNVELVDYHGTIACAGDDPLARAISDRVCAVVDAPTFQRPMRSTRSTARWNCRRACRPSSSTCSTWPWRRRLRLRFVLDNSPPITIDPPPEIVRRLIALADGNDTADVLLKFLAAHPKTIGPVMERIIALAGDGGRRSLSVARRSPASPRSALGARRTGRSCSRRGAAVFQAAGLYGTE